MLQPKSDVHLDLHVVQQQLQGPTGNGGGMQRRGSGTWYAGRMDALRKTGAQEGVRGFYRGWSANTLKVVPQNAIRFVSYEALKGVFGVVKAKTDT